MPPYNCPWKTASFAQTDESRCTSPPLTKTLSNEHKKLGSDRSTFQQPLASTILFDTSGALERCARVITAHCHKLVGPVIMLALTISPILYHLELLHSMDTPTNKDIYHNNISTLIGHQRNPLRWVTASEPRSLVECVTMQVHYWPTLHVHSQQEAEQFSR